MFRFKMNTYILTLVLLLIILNILIRNSIIHLCYKSTRTNILLTILVQLQVIIILLSIFMDIIVFWLSWLGLDVIHWCTVDVLVYVNLVFQLICIFICILWINGNSGGSIHRRCLTGFDVNTLELWRLTFTVS